MASSTRSSRDSSPDSAIGLCKPKHAPTELYPTPRVPLRTTFKNFHSFATVIVGTDKSEQRFSLHTDLLTSCSPFFAAALNGSFSESTTQTVSLPEETPSTFEWFIQWLYTGSLTTATPSCYPSKTTPLLPPQTHTDGDLRNSAGSPKYFLLLDLYGLSDRLLTTALSNTIIDTIARLSEATNSVPTPSDTFILYETIRDTAPIRALVLDLFTYKKTDKLLETHPDEWNGKFLRDLVVKIKRPGRENLGRHELREWKCVAWQTVRACEGCKDVIRPAGSAGARCEVCNRVYCHECVGKHGGTLVGVDVGVCKPWLRGLCARYHEHGPGGVGCGH